jgi:hypothetical protein
MGTLPNGIRISVTCYATMAYRRSRSRHSCVPVEGWGGNLGVLDDSGASCQGIALRNIA